jgi:two-component system, cell cycle sensor histidine kinase and response regulator CckA
MTSEKPTETILIVDDEPFILDLACSMLKRNGYNVLCASSAQQALDLIQTDPDQKIDLALLDIVMPGMDGAELALHLTEMRPNLSIMFMSGYAENPEVRPERFRQVMFLAKPFSSLVLAAKVREAIDAPRSDSTASTELS